MITPASVAGTIAVLLTVTTFIWRLRRERREVINRGVNQSPALTWVRPLVYTLYRAVVYVALAYLLISGYYLIKYRHRCRATPESRAAYEAANVRDHLLEALAWPVTYQGGPECLEEE
ncbi:MAG: hypothetical protein KJ047_08935 [Anaerolineae bacterium]|nr:hypothetical protein [Anaerolineae bacterium]